MLDMLHVEAVTVAQGWECDIFMLWSCNWQGLQPLHYWLHQDAAFVGRKLMTLSRNHDHVTLSVRYLKRKLVPHQVS